tara:strand:- start:2156 stop:2644 length:489 start_codon:yes stop_codon:yes gene_type:complete
MKNKLLTLFLTLMISNTMLAASISEEEVIDSINGFFNGLNIKNYSDDSLNDFVTNDFIIFELANSFTLDEFKIFLESAGFSNWVSTDWSLTDFTISIDESSAHASYLNTGIFIYPDPKDNKQLLREDVKWLESVYLVKENKKLKLKFLQSDDIQRTVKPFID